MGTEHFTMCIDKDSLSHGLFEQFFKILEIMTGHQDGLAFFMAQGNRCGYRMSVCFCIACIQ
jgi:hypothetical protein